MQFLSATDAIRPALQRTREVLVHPFAWPRFFGITLVASLAIPSVGLPSFLTRKLDSDNAIYEHQFGALTFSPTAKFFFIGNSDYSCHHFCDCCSSCDLPLAIHAL